MGKVIPSPVKKWPGTVTLFEPMTFPQYLAWKQAVSAAGEHIKDNRVLWDEYDAALAPGILACVEKWELAGLPDKPTGIPATPRLASHKLISAIMRGISELIAEDEDIPKE